MGWMSISLFILSIIMGAVIFLKLYLIINKLIKQLKDRDKKIFLLERDLKESILNPKTVIKEVKIDPLTIQDSIVVEYSNFDTPDKKSYIRDIIGKRLGDKLVELNVIDSEIIHDPKEEFTVKIISKIMVYDKKSNKSSQP